MFANKTLFPTKKEIAKKMIEDYKPHHYWSNCQILEPSAGKGDLLKGIIDFKTQLYDSYSKISKSNIDCIEIDTQLQGILRNDDFRVIDNDFLQFKPEKHYDLIIMNPPFNNGIGIDHFLKACEIANGAEIRCLLPTEYLRNPSNSKRELLLKNIEILSGTYEDLGRCFEDAERKTMIEVSLIKIPYKKREPMFNFSGKKTGEKEFTVDDFNNNQVEKLDVIESLIDRYNKVKELKYEIEQKKSEMSFYLSGLVNNDTSFCNPINRGYKDVGIDEWIENLRHSAWSNILTKTNIQNLVTEKVRNDFNTFINQQGCMAFTAENIENLFKTLMLNQGVIIESCITDAFDQMTKYYKENRWIPEGWKTNDSWKVNRKVILPRAIDDFYIKYDCKMYLNYSFRDKITDIEKALCFVAKIEYNDIKDKGIVQTISNGGLDFGKWYPSYFFRFKCFKKGTIHLEFIDIDIWKRFNYIACKNKNWLPDSK